MVVWNVFHLKNHFDTTIEIQPLLKNIISIVFKDEFRQKDHFTDTIEVQVLLKLFFNRGWE